MDTGVCVCVLVALMVSVFCLVLVFYFPAFMAFSRLPEVARKIRLFLALAPVATVAFTSSPMTKLSVLPEFLMWVRTRPAPGLLGDILLS